MKFNSETELKAIALSDASARQVLDQAGLDYCCGGTKSLQEACLGSSVSAEEILNRLREKTAENSCGDDVNWMATPLRELTRHIRETHHRYVRQAIPRLRSLLDQVIARHGETHRELPNIGAAFNEVAREMVMHMQKEEQILFPYIDALELAVSQHESVEPPFFQTVKNPIYAMIREHDAAGEMVKRIRGLSGDYTVPADACTAFTTLYQGLKEFESDLHQHVHLENNILFPRAAEMEDSAA